MRPARALPISFMVDMIDAYRAGRKGQTRRLADLATVDGAGVPARYRIGPLGYVQTFIGDVTGDPETDDEAWMMVSADWEAGYRCRYGQAGGTLWVKEPLRPGYNERLVRYQAGGDLALREGKPVPWPWKTSTLGAIYCPRWASRFTLDVLSVRLERLQDITAADAIDEGILPEPGDTGRWLAPLVKAKAGTATMAVEDPRTAYLALWDLINGAGSAGLNPWVFVITFPRRLQ